VIPILLIVVLVLLIFRSRRAPIVSRGTGLAGRDPIRLILLIIVVLLLIGLLASLFMPLGNYRLWSR
jgi:hypothetical protein